MAGLSFAQVAPGSVLFQDNAGTGTLVNNLGANGYLEWTLPGPQNGFGGTFDITAGNSGVVFAVNDLNLGWIDVCGAGMACFGANQAYAGFYGFTSTDRFTGVRTFAGPGTGSSYSMTDVSIGSAQIPEPGVMTLMLAGLAGLGFARQQRKA